MSRRISVGLLLLIGVFSTLACVEVSVSTSTPVAREATLTPIPTWTPRQISTDTPAPTATPIAQEPSPTPIPAATSTPISGPTPIAVTARILVEEREANATRYDLTYMDNWVAVSGTITEIDDGAVYLWSNIRSNFDRIALHDLPVEVQAAVEDNQDFTAVCKVGRFLISTHNLRECRVTPTSQSAEEQATTDSQGQPTWVTEAPVRPSEWTTVAHAKDALRLCYYELLALDRYRGFFETLPRPSPEDVEETLAWAVFNNGWAGQWWVEKPDGLPPGTEDIWSYGYGQGCWVGVDGLAYLSISEPKWDPQWR